MACIEEEKKKKKEKKREEEEKKERERKKRKEIKQAADAMAARITRYAGCVPTTTSAFRHTRLPSCKHRTRNGELPVGWERTCCATWLTATRQLLSNSSLVNGKLVLFWFVVRFVRFNPLCHRHAPIHHHHHTTFAHLPPAPAYPTVVVFALVDLRSVGWTCARALTALTYRCCYRALPAPARVICYHLYHLPKPLPTTMLTWFSRRTWCAVATDYLTRLPNLLPAAAKPRFATTCTPACLTPLPTCL